MTSLETSLNQETKLITFPIEVSLPIKTMPIVYSEFVHLSPLSIKIIHSLFVFLSILVPTHGSMPTIVTIANDCSGFVRLWISQEVS